MKLNGTKFTTNSGKAARVIWQKKYHRTFHERLWSKIDKRGNDECWPWTGCRTGKGYGMILAEHERKYILAHRAVWSELNGAIPPRIEICHRCDNPGCCNLSHLFAGTHKQNMEDCAVKKRFNPIRGESQHASKLTSSKIASAIKDRASGMSFRTLARKYEVSTASIHRAVTGRTWKHLH